MIKIKTIFGKLIYESKKATLKEAIKEYIEKELSLGKSYADLSFADLSFANLSFADLSSADLSSANLRSADLSFADLSSADLSSADLDKRYLSVSCIGSSKRMTTYCFDDDVIWCGCFTGSLKEFKKEVKETHRDNEQYLKEYLGFIKYLKSLKD